MKKAILCLATAGLLAGMPVCLQGQVIPIDDFDHMNPALPGWTLADLSAGQPWGPGDLRPEFRRPASVPLGERAGPAGDALRDDCHVRPVERLDRPAVLKRLPAGEDPDGRTTEQHVDPAAGRPSDGNRRTCCLASPSRLGRCQS